jgi:hypothetical protein
MDSTEPPYSQVRSRVSLVTLDFLSSSSWWKPFSHFRRRPASWQKCLNPWGVKGRWWSTMPIISRQAVWPILWTT